MCRMFQVLLVAVTCHQVFGKWKDYKKYDKKEDTKNAEPETVKHDEKTMKDDYNYHYKDKEDDCPPKKYC